MKKILVNSFICFALLANIFQPAIFLQNTNSSLPYNDEKSISVCDVVPTPAQLLNKLPLKIQQRVISGASFVDHNENLSATLLRHFNIVTLPQYNHKINERTFLSSQFSTST